MKETNHRKPGTLGLRLHGMPRMGTSIETKNRLVVTYGWGDMG